MPAPWRLIAVMLAALWAAPASAQPADPPRDSLGRDSPRGTLFGFMAAARKGNYELAALYLNTRLRDQAAAELATQLYVVLDTRLPARLPVVSDKPEGSLPNPLKPDQDLLGTIDSESGPLDLLVERVARGPTGRVWLFSGRTLDAIPAVYDEVHRVPAEQFLPAFLMRPRIAGIRLFDWLAFFIVLPLFYRVIGIGRRVPGEARLFLIAVAIRSLLRGVDLPLVERQFWTTVSAMMFVAALVWFAAALARASERYLLRRMHSSALGDTTSLLRLARWTLDVLIFVAGGLAVLRYFRVDATAALAGLGIGGIAVALSAQKTLENVIGGLSIIFDRAVRVGDFLKVGPIAGQVEFVGLRSTRIRTLDRTILSVPNGQIASVNIETLSERDKFWFHHFLGLSYDTSLEQLRAITAELRDLLRRHTRADDSSIRVRVVRLAQFSIDIEVGVYLFAADWDNFLELQESLLFDVIETVGRHGATIAFPTQTVHVRDRDAAEMDRFGAFAAHGDRFKPA